MESNPYDGGGYYEVPRVTPKTKNSKKQKNQLQIASSPWKLKVKAKLMAKM